MAYLLKQDVSKYHDITLSGQNDWREASITFTADIEFCTEADICFLRIDDGDSTTDGEAHTGDNTRQSLSVTHTISEDATKIEAVVYFNPTESMGIWVYNTALKMNDYTRNVSAGCPCCASYLYDPRQRITPFPKD